MVNKGPVGLPVPGWAMPIGTGPPSPPPIDYQKLLDKLLPPADGEDMTRLRTGIVDAVNADGTLDVGISGLVIPSVPRLTNAPMVAGSVVNVLVWRGGLLVIGTSSAGPAGLTTTGLFRGVCTNDVALTPGAAAVTVTGCTFNFTTVRANAVIVVNLVIDFDATNATTGTATGFIRLDSTDLNTELATFGNPGNASARGTVAQNYTVSVATAGPHTMTARATSSGAGTAISARAGHSTIVGTLYETG